MYETENIETPTPQSPVYAPAPPVIQTQKGRAAAIASLACGIASLALFFIPFLPFALAIVAIACGAAYLGISSVTSGKKGLAIGGVVCGAVGALVSIIVSSLLIFAIGCAVGVDNTHGKSGNTTPDDRYYYSLPYDGFESAPYYPDMGELFDYNPNGDPGPFWDNSKNSNGPSDSGKNANSGKSTF